MKNEMNKVESWVTMIYNFSDDSSKLEQQRLVIKQGLRRG